MPDVNVVENPKDGSEKDYEAENALDHMMRAHEMMNNEDLMKRVHKRAGRKAKALKGLMGEPKVKSIQDIIDIRNKKAMEEDDGE